MSEDNEDRESSNNFGERTKDWSKSSSLEYPESKSDYSTDLLTFATLGSLLLRIRAAKHVEFEDKIGIIFNNLKNSKEFDKATFIRAVNLLRNILEKLWSESKDIHIPSILSDDDGSINIDWVTENFELLIYIPSEISMLIHFYGEKVGSLEDSIEVRINYKLVESVIIDWLKKIL